MWQSVRSKLFKIVLDTASVIGPLGAASTPMPGNQNCLCSAVKARRGQVDLVGVVVIKSAHFQVNKERRSDWKSLNPAAVNPEAD